MGRNHRHKKDLRAEKAKVKLKQSKTKFLPKGLNVTNTNFKIKPIVISEQLKEKQTDVPLSRRKLNIKDLLSRIKHHNENVSSIACDELSEMIRIHSEQIINNHLADVILNVSTLMQDREPKVRKALVRVISAIIETASEDKLKPFFNYFSSNLCCAMTNIDKNIQEDSLKYLDCFLKINSGLISQTLEKLLPNFFTLISKLRGDANLGRTLTVNLGSKMTSVTWRIKVLSRLHAILESILSNSMLEKTAKLDATENYKDPYNGNTFPIYKDAFAITLELPMTSYGSVYGSATSSDVFNRHIVTLVPLLYETWIECQFLFVLDNTILNEESSAILSCVVNTLYLLWKYVKKNESDEINVKNVFLSEEGKKFLNHLLINFPYCQTDKKVKHKKTNGMKLLEINNDPKCVRENLLVCYMYCVLNVNHSHNSLKAEMQAVTTYVAKCLLMKRYVDRNTTSVLIEFLKSCLVENPQIWRRAGADLKSILEYTITFYNNNMTNEKHIPDVFTILLNVADIPYLSNSQQYHAWLVSLPDLLCQPKITDVLVEALLRLSRRNNEVFHDALLKALPTILEKLEDLNIVLTNESLNNNEQIVKKEYCEYILFPT
ncbi:hypothetical protein NQ318_011264 [Aromia moschata]|uniref:Pre-rRNA-processing protein Ipi1 N-terminal domain-containing protein n=1 Tax=Aromia moschata TaxID=1265417 RepID=A0AAV8YJF8_9CUCU|nr:hypothetical protein NQ318_011264 [Aromia moschata]